MLRGLLIAGLFVLLPMAMLYPLWSCPTSAGEDDVVYYWPLRTMVAEQVRQGHWPLWNAREAAGVALLGDPQSAVFFPPNWLFLVLPGQLAFSLCIFLAFATAGGGAYLYCRRVGLATPAAIFAGLAFAFCGFMVGHRVHLGLIQSAAMLPWGLWCIEKMRKDRRAALAPMALVFALTQAAGHWPTAIQLTLVWAVYLLVRARPLLRSIALAGVAAVLGAALIAPQVIAVAVNLPQTIRGHVPYAVAGENSFFPLCGVLGFYPFLMGCRTQNLFPQPWWGPWHLCEMLGYVGLATLVLAWAAIWRLGRKASPLAVPATAKQQRPVTGEQPLRPLVRLWTWMLIGAGIWALGYYLPLYWLIHKIPIFGTVRCPARMLLVIDFALAFLAAGAIHSLVTNPPPALTKTLRRSGFLYLPMCMIAGIGLLALAGAGEGRRWRIEPLLTVPADGSSAVERMRQAASPASPAVLVPLLLAGATIIILWRALKSPQKGAWAMIGLLVLDLFFIARFVDVPGRGQNQPDPENSPAGKWLAANASTTQPYRVLGLSRDYHARAPELLLPKTCAGLGFETISYYGPLGPSRYFQLFGFRPWGANENWQWLIRRNHLLSLFNVRYVLAGDEEYRLVIESVRVSDQPPLPDGPNLLEGQWSFHNGREESGVIHLKAPHIWSPAWASTPIRLPVSHRPYRIALDIRAPEGAGNSVSAQYADPGTPVYLWGQAGFLRVDLEQLTPSWRHFERTFAAPSSAGDQAVFRLYTPSDQPIEVRNVSLRASSWETPVNFAGPEAKAGAASSKATRPKGMLAPGERVYVDLTPAGLPPLRGGDPPVHIYENRLCLPRSFQAKLLSLPDENAVIEALRWEFDKYDFSRVALVTNGAAERPDGEIVSASPALLHDRGRPVAGAANALGTVSYVRQVRHVESQVAAEVMRLGVTWGVAVQAVVTLILLSAAWRARKLNLLCPGS